MPTPDTDHTVTAARGIVTDARTLLDRWNSATGADSPTAVELAVALAGVVRILDGQQLYAGDRVTVGRGALTFSPTRVGTVVQRHAPDVDIEFDGDGGGRYPATAVRLLADVENDRP
ncbi:hypothetical protein [Tsukamurella hominis]|uniref:hypothetical protein n=1 Tax=Tsukamurella hominis TaxID=1970232 RepID=UPI0039E7A6F6